LRPDEHRRSAANRDVKAGDGIPVDDLEQVCPRRQRRNRYDKVLTGVVDTHVFHLDVRERDPGSRAEVHALDVQSLLVSGNGGSRDHWFPVELSIVRCGCGRRHRDDERDGGRGPRECGSHAAMHCRSGTDSSAVRKS
jgi:hypothetical protein